MQPLSRNMIAAIAATLLSSTAYAADYTYALANVRLNKGAIVTGEFTVHVAPHGRPSIKSYMFKVTGLFKKNFIINAATCKQCSVTIAYTDTPGGAAYPSLFVFTQNLPRLAGNAYNEVYFNFTLPESRAWHSGAPDVDFLRAGSSASSGACYLNCVGAGQYAAFPTGHLTLKATAP